MNMTSIARLTGVATLVGLTACAGNGDRLTLASTGSLDCAALSGKTIGGAVIYGAALVSATSASGGSLATPEHCKLTARVAPQLNFEMRLPTSWNGKLHYTGGGGFNGSIPPVDKSALAQGYVDVSSDSGHTGTSSLDGSFALNDPVAFRLFSRLSVPTVTAAAKLITAAAYGKPPIRSYFEGCSNGGREGLMTALRFPTLFDGVIAKAPAKFIAPIESYQRTARVLGSIPGNPFNSAKLSLLSSSLLGACDALDGVKDDIIANPAACKFDVGSLRCPSGADEGDSCLSDTQVNAVKTVTTRMAGGVGTQYVNSAAPFSLNGEIASPGGWGSWILGDPQKTITGLFGASLVKNLLRADPLANWINFDFKGNAPLVQVMTDEIDVSDPNLTPFKLNGGKLILWHGAADPAVPMQQTIEYASAVSSVIGGPAEMDNFSRLYIAPGVLHCSGGTGADQTTALLPALDAWITHKNAPGDLLAQRLNRTSGERVMSRPLCRYPTFPRYRGTGDVNDASSYSCASS